MTFTTNLFLKSALYWIEWTISISGPFPQYRNAVFIEYVAGWPTGRSGLFWEELSNSYRNSNPGPYIL